VTDYLTKLHQTRPKN